MDGIEVPELVIELMKDHSKIMLVPMGLRMLQNNNLVASCSCNRLEESFQPGK